MKLSAKYTGKPSKTPKMMVTYAEKKKLENMPVEERTEASREMIGYDKEKNGRNPKGEAAIRQEEYHKQTLAKQNMKVKIDVAKRQQQAKINKMPDAPLIRTSEKAEENFTQKSLNHAAVETDPSRAKRGWEKMADQTEKSQEKIIEEIEQDKKKTPIVNGGFKKHSLGMR